MQHIPSDWAARELLRDKGQFWTPPWVASAMVAYVLADGSHELFDPAVGEGAFFAAALQGMHGEFRYTPTNLEMRGQELDPEAIAIATTKLGPAITKSIRVGDFVLDPPNRTYSAIVANPPYIRHHRISAALKEKLRAFVDEHLDFHLDSRAGLHVFFLIRALLVLKPGGRLAFIMPADTAEGVFAQSLWRWITTRYSLEAVVTFSPEATPFPRVDTNPIVLFIRNADQVQQIAWAQVRTRDTGDLLRLALGTLSPGGSRDVVSCIRTIMEALRTGLTREPLEGHSGETVKLFRLATVMRGVASGDNNYFFMTSRRAEELGIGEEFLVRAIGRTRDLPTDTDELTLDHLDRLDRAGRPTWLFAPDGRQLDLFPEQVRMYLREGEAQGVPTRALIRTRNPWYKMEKRRISEYLFAYLGRRNARFINNAAGVIPLTSFLCVYARCADIEFVRELWAVLRNPRTVDNLKLVGKSYGSGAIKVEPRALEQLPVPKELISTQRELAGFLDGTIGEQLSIEGVREPSKSASPESAHPRAWD